MSQEKDCEEYQSGETLHKPYCNVLDEYRIRCIRKPKDDLEYSIGKMMIYLAKFLSTYRVSKNKKKYKAKLIHKKTDELKVKTLKIRDKQSSFRAKISILVEETNID